MSHVKCLNVTDLSCFVINLPYGQYAETAMPRADRRGNVGRHKCVYMPENENMFNSKYSHMIALAHKHMASLVVRSTLAKINKK